MFTNEDKNEAAITTTATTTTIALSRFVYVYRNAKTQNDKTFKRTNNKATTTTTTTTKKIDSDKTIHFSYGTDEYECVLYDFIMREICFEVDRVGPTYASSIHITQKNTENSKYYKSQSNKVEFIRTATEAFFFFRPPSPFQNALTMMDGRERDTSGCCCVCVCACVLCKRSELLMPPLMPLPPATVLQEK